MKAFACATMVLLALGGSHLLSRSSGDEPASPPANEKPAKPIADKNAELTAIRAGSQAFIAAFDKGDAKALAALWTEDGEYIDDAGRQTTGRAAIEQEYKRFFAEQPGRRLRLVIDSLKLLSDSAAIEDGRVILDPPPEGPPAISRYTAVHVKVDGRWLMSLVRDSRVETPSAYHKLQDLEWMIGDWNAEEQGATSEVRCRWIASKSFLQRDYSVVEAAGHVSHSGVQIIGWNPDQGRLQSWTFSSDGSYAIGVWTPAERGWTVDSHGVLPDGTATNARTSLKRLDDNAMAWKSEARTAAGTALPDTDEIILKRVPIDR